MPSLKFGDIIKAVRPLDTALPQFHSVGHESGPFLVLSTSVDQICCLYFTSNPNAQDCILVDNFDSMAKGNSYIKMDMVFELRFHHFESATPWHLSAFDIKKIQKRIMLRGVKKYNSDDILIMTFDNPIDFETGDLVAKVKDDGVSNEEFIIVRRESDNSFICVKATGMKAKTADNQTNIDYYNPRLIARSDLKYINTLPGWLLNVVLKNYRNIIRPFFDKNGKWRLPKGALIKKPYVNTFYVYDVKDGIAHCFAVFYKKIGVEPMPILGKQCYILFDCLYYIDVAKDNYLVEALATSKEIGAIEEKLIKYLNNGDPTRIEEPDGLVGEVIYFRDEPEDRKFVVSRQSNTYFMYRMSDLLLRRYDMGYFVKKDITVCLGVPTPEELEAINSLYGQPITDSGVARSLIARRGITKSED